MNEVMVSILCTAYNHESYLRDCLEGFVQQETTFPFEVIIHDDASTDSTADIIREYEKKYPNIIKPIYQTENQYSQDVDIYKDFLLPRIRGRYVAFCEGDDFWTDRQKLQKQFDFMEAHAECAICVHKVKMVDGVTNQFITYTPAVEIKESVLAANAYLNAWKDNNWIFQTSSFFLRAELYREYCNNEPKFQQVTEIVDEPMLLWFSTKGCFGYLEEVMSCYRFQAPGSWSVQNKAEGSEHARKSLINNYRMYYEFDLYTNHAHHELLQEIMEDTVKVLYCRKLIYGWNDIDFSEFIPLSTAQKLYLHYRALRTKLKHTLLK